MKDHEIIESLYRLYEQEMYRLAFCILHDEYAAEDAVQEAFIKLIACRRKLDVPESPQTHAYAMTVLKSCAIDLYRRRKREAAAITPSEDPADEPACEDPLITPRELVRLTDRLPEKYRQVILCRCIRGLTSRETAAVLNIREPAVRKRFERAKALLHSLAGQED